MFSRLMYAVPVIGERTMLCELGFERTQCADISKAPSVSPHDVIRREPKMLSPPKNASSHEVVLEQGYEIPTGLQDCIINADFLISVAKWCSFNLRNFAKTLKFI